MDSSTTQTAPSQIQLVEAQWASTADLVDMPSRVARALWAARHTDLVRNASEVRALTSWAELAPATAAIQNMPENRARVARVLDFIQDGDRLVDIGCGNGSLGGQILRRKQLGLYLGIDASSNAIASFRSMAKANEISDDRYHLVEAMVEQAGKREIPEADPTLVFLLEMLEHVSDPGLVLRQAAASVGSQTDILISVPLLGSIEHEWGHVSVFDRARIERMARDAALYIHWVEPVMAQWLLVLLSKDPNPRPRVEGIVRQRDRPIADLAADDRLYYFRNLQIDDTTVMATTARPSARSDLQLDAGQAGVKLQIPSTSGNGLGGVTIYRPGMEVLRLQLSAEDSSAITGATVEFRAGGVTLERWRIQDEEIARLTRPRTWVFRRGFDHGRPHQNLVAHEQADRLDVVFATKAGSMASITFHAAHFIASIDNPTQSRRPSFVGLP